MVLSKGKKNYEKINNSDDIEQAIPNQEITLQIKLPEDKVYSINISPGSKVGDLKEKIEEKSGIPKSRQRIIHFGKLLNDENKSLTDLSISDGNFIHLMPLPDNVRSSTHASGISNSNSTVPIAAIPSMNLEYLNEYGNFSAEEYFQTVELGLWRARVRLLGSLLMFFYFLQAMGNLSLWLHPEEMDLRYEKNHHPSDLFFTFDLIEAIIGVGAALSAMKAANSDSVNDSALFLRNCLETAVIHFVAFIIYNKELLEGKIQMNPRFTYNKPHDSNNVVEQEAIFMGVVFGFLVNVMVWWTILSIAVKYHQSLVSRLPVEEEVEEPDSETMPNREVVEQIV